MNINQLEKGIELQSLIKDCNEKLKRYEKLEVAKQLCIYNTDPEAEGTSVYICRDKCVSVIKTIKDYEQLKINGYLLEFEKL